MYRILTLLMCLWSIELSAQFKKRPAILYNDNDGISLGMDNKYTSVNRDFLASVKPMYAFGSQSLVGNIRLSKRIKSDHNIGVEAKSFHFNRNKKWDYSQRYIKVEPSYAHITGDPDLLSDHKRYYVQLPMIFEETPRFDQGAFVGKDRQQIYLAQLGYDKKTSDSTHTYFLQTQLEASTYAQPVSNNQQSYLKATASYTYNYIYRRKKTLNVRFFASGFLFNTQRESSAFQNIFTRGSIALIHQGFNDYTYDEDFLSRQNQNKTFDRQVSLISGGGFRSAIGSQYGIGMSNNFAAAVNVSVDIPWRLPLSIYMDNGIYSIYNNQKAETRWLFNAGLSLSLLKKTIRIHLPILANKELKNIIETQHPNVFSRLSFSLDMTMIMKKISEIDKSLISNF
jgi:hypothetical protein